MDATDSTASGISGTNARVTRLWRYPVKSMMGEECASLEVDGRGATGDRLFAVRDADGKFGSGKTTRRFRRIDGLLGFRAAYEAGVPRVTFPDGRALLASDPSVDAALSGALGQSVTLVREAAISHMDAGPLHLLTTASLAWLQALLPDARVDDRRFRPNVLIDIAARAHVERTWLGRVVHVGQVTLRIRGLTERCVMVNLPQAGLPEDPRLLRTLGHDSGPHFGVYAEVLAAGTIHRGDPVLAGE